MPECHLKVTIDLIFFCNVLVSIFQLSCSWMYSMVHRFFLHEFPSISPDYLPQACDRLLLQRVDMKMKGRKVKRCLEPASHSNAFPERWQGTIKQWMCVFLNLVNCPPLSSSIKDNCYIMIFYKNYVNCIFIFCISAAGPSGRAVSVETEEATLLLKEITNK